jgi:site-specific recombinase XerD
LTRFKANRFIVNNVPRDLRAHVKKASIQHTAAMSVHCLRKFFAQNHADRRTPSVTLKGLAGHASITTTEKHHLQQSDANRQAAIRR